MASKRDATAGLSLLRLHDQTRVVRAITEQLAGELEDYDPASLRRSESIRADAPRVRRIERLAEALVDGVDIIHDLARTLTPREGSGHRAVVAWSEPVVEAAGAWLEKGIADPRQLLLAAQLLPPRRGLLALAIALETSEHPAQSTLPIREVIGSLSGIPATVVASLETAADVDFSSPFNRLTPKAIARLATVLRLTAESWRNVLLADDETGDEL